MHEIKAYQCAYCKKYSKSKSVIKKHETECFHNPVTKSCATCANCSREHYKVDKKALDFDSDIVGDVYSHKPVCSGGKTISHLKGGIYKADLRSKCECWIEKEEED